MYGRPDSRRPRPFADVKWPMFTKTVLKKIKILLQKLKIEVHFMMTQSGTALGPPTGNACLLEIVQLHEAVHTDARDCTRFSGDT